MRHCPEVRARGKDFPLPRLIRKGVSAIIVLRPDRTRAQRALLQRQIEAVSRTVPNDIFREALELGAGDGFQSQFLTRCAKKVLCTDLNADRLGRKPHSRIAYEICDAEALPYESGRFDFIFSSNLLEH